MFKVYSTFVNEFQFNKVEIELTLTRGIPEIVIIGLPGKIISESIYRIKQCFISNFNFFPDRKVLINLIPSEIKKNVSLFDFAICSALYLEILFSEYIKKREDIIEKIYLNFINFLNSNCSKNIFELLNIKHSQYEKKLFSLNFKNFKSLLIRGTKDSNYIFREIFNNIAIYGSLKLDGNIFIERNLFPYFLKLNKYSFKYVITPSMNMEKFLQLFDRLKIKFINLSSFFEFVNIVNLCVLLKKDFLSIFDNLSINNKSYDNNKNFKFQNTKNLHVIESYDIDKLSNKDLIKFDKFKLKNTAKYNFLENLTIDPFLLKSIIISCAGFHNIFISGPAGTGKSLSIKLIELLLPDLTFDEILEITYYHSISEIISNNEIINKRPIRKPHSSITLSSMIGGGKPLKVGEITLAHGGVLVLDEINFFNRKVIESLRDPLQEKVVRISRNNEKIELPSTFILVMISNLCPCGNLGSSFRKCFCTQKDILNFNKKVSNALMDRIDLIVKVSDKQDCDNTNIITFSKDKKTTDLSKLKNQIQKAVELQRKRYNNNLNYFNGKVKSSEFFANLNLSSNALNLLNELKKMNRLSYRKFEILLRVARTIADLNENEEIKEIDLQEARFFVKNFEINLLNKNYI